MGVCRRNIVFAVRRRTLGTTKEFIMAKKKIAAVIKLQVPAGKATPAPPVGPALGPHGVSAPQFVQQFNDRTKNVEQGLLIPVVITVYGDKSFSFHHENPAGGCSYPKGLQTGQRVRPSLTR